MNPPGVVQGTEAHTRLYPLCEFSGQTVATRGPVLISDIPGATGLKKGRRDPTPMLVEPLQMCDSCRLRLLSPRSTWGAPHEVPRWRARSVMHTSPTGGAPGPTRYLSNALGAGQSTEMSEAGRSKTRAWGIAVKVCQRVHSHIPAAGSQCPVPSALLSMSRGAPLGVTCAKGPREPPLQQQYLCPIWFKVLIFRDTDKHPEWWEKCHLAKRWQHNLKPRRGLRRGEMSVAGPAHQACLCSFIFGSSKGP